ncbi:MAG TPA: hypothetical protein VH395_15725, partial [Jatrophihabitantaceae bacterium]
MLRTIHSRTAWLVSLAAIGAGLVLAVAASPARATYPPGMNGKIAFSTDLGPDPQVFSVNPDGTGETQLTQSTDGHSTNPGWTPDG